MFRKQLLISAAGLFCALASSSAAQRLDPDCYNGRLTCLSIGPGRELTPAEKAEQERRNREAAAAAAAKKAKVDGLVTQWGEHRRAEAEKFVAMQLAAEAARPKPLASKAPAHPPRTCSTSTTQQARKATFPFLAVDQKTYQVEGRAEMVRNVQMACDGGVMNTYSCKGGGVIGAFACQVAFTCPVKKTTCTGGPPASKVSAQ